MAEQLICNQQVVGSTPITSLSSSQDEKLQLNMGEFPSGQRGQTVNLLAPPSVVRIHLPPAKNKCRIRRVRFFVFLRRVLEQHRARTKANARPCTYQHRSCRAQGAKRVLRMVPESTFPQLKRKTSSFSLVFFLFVWRTVLEQHRARTKANARPCTYQHRSCRAQGAKRVLPRTGSEASLAQGRMNPSSPANTNAESTHAKPSFKAINKSGDGRTALPATAFSVS